MLNKTLHCYHSENDFNQIHESLKHIPCPHCQSIGALILHGLLYGYDNRSNQKNLLRGHRIFCSNRYRRYGCGKTFSISSADFIRHFTITAQNLWNSLILWLNGIPPHRIFKTLNIRFSSATIYRLIKTVMTAQSRIRTCLFRHYPQPPSCGNHALEQTIKHLIDVFKNDSNPIAAFQLCFQEPFL